MDTKKITLKLESLEDRIAPTIVTMNPGGNSPSGAGALNGQSVDAYNPAGHTPGGQQIADNGAGTGG
jgi:hypothetical protein